MGCIDHDYCCGGGWMKTRRGLDQGQKDLGGDSSLCNRAWTGLAGLTRRPVWRAGRPGRGMGPTSVACGLVASLSPTAVRFGLFGTGYSQNSSTSAVVLVLVYMYVLGTRYSVLSPVSQSMGGGLLPQLSSGSADGAAELVAFWGQKWSHPEITDDLNSTIRSRRE